MKLNYQFSNLLGQVYHGRGNLVFTPDGNTILSPVGKRVMVFDLAKNKSHTIECENFKDICVLAVSPNGNLVLSVDTTGHAILINLHHRRMLSSIKFEAKVKCAAFSPDGKYFAIGVGPMLQIWRTPPSRKEFQPFRLYRTYKRHFNRVMTVSWSKDSKYVLSGSLDLTVCINSVENENEENTKLSGHSSEVLGCYFGDTNEEVYTVSGSQVFSWKFERALLKPKKEEQEDAEDDDNDQVDKKINLDANFGELAIQNGRWNLVKTLKPEFRVTSSAHRLVKGSAGLLVLGFSNGQFTLYDLPEFNALHTLKISDNKVNSCAINNTGEWLAFGSGKHGQLLVWEWQSETYIIKQQGHTLDITCMSFSPDGQMIATGSDDGRIKLWHVHSGFCFSTFSEHTAPVTAIVFTQNGGALVSASHDGTVRAYDVGRYKNFRTMTSNETAATTLFSSLAVDPSGEIVCAATRDTFEIFTWSLQTGKLLEILSGHEAPISSLYFHPVLPTLISSSWDKTVRLWDVYESASSKETFQHESDVIEVSVRPDGNELVTCTLDGQLTVWDIEEAKVMGTIEGLRDIAASSKPQDVKGKHFVSVSYSADGEYILAGGNNAKVLIYDIKNKVLLRRIDLAFGDFTGKKLPFEMEYEVSDLVSLPGVKKGDLSKRAENDQLRIKSVCFSPTNRVWAAATTEGLFLYSLDTTSNFDPYDLDVDITPKTVLAAVEKKEYLKALVMSFRLNEAEITLKAFEAIPPEHIQIVASSFPTDYVQRLMNFVSDRVDKSPHLEFYLLWCIHLMNFHGSYLKENSSSLLSTLRNLQKNISLQQLNLAKLSDDNMYSMEYLKTNAALQKVEDSAE